MQRPWNQQKTREEWSLCVQCRYTVERPPPLQHRLAPSSLDGQCQWCPVPLLGTSCSTGGELFNAGSLETGVDTHTHTLLPCTGHQHQASFAAFYDSTRSSSDRQPVRGSLHHLFESLERTARGPLGTFAARSGRLQNGQKRREHLPLKSFGFLID